MTASRPDDEAIFHAARGIPDPDRRREYVREACGGDEAQIAHVEALLAAAGAPDRLLDRPAVGPGGGDDLRTGPPAPDDDLPLDFLSPSDKPGALGRLGHYDILEIIGRGGMGTVLRAFDDKLHRVVAIKVLAAQLATNAAARRRFTREAQAQAAVSHDHVVTIHAVEGDRPQPYLVMQYVAGPSLQQRLDRDGPLALHEILRVGLQTASGLSAAHAQGLVHRDIKPANLLLENGVERVKITDFGLARAAHEASVTQSGVVTGTPQYMSPEQAEGKPLDHRTDLFSLGSVLYAMCTGRAPFRASGTLAVLKRVCEGTPTPIREANPDIPDGLIAIIDKLHAKDPSERFQSAAEVAELLGRHLAHVQHPSAAPLQTAPSLPSPLGRRVGGEERARPRLHGRWAVAAAVLLLLLGGLSLTEATGLTNLSAPVIRIFTPDGTLVVEADDPAVRVTVEGDGGLVITGAGLEEIRLRPGSYRVHANRDGKRLPLDRDLVTVTRGGRAVVKVKLETSPAPGIAQADEGAFMLLGSKGAEVRRFATLAEAVRYCAGGDTIEVRGDGPFDTRRVTIKDKALTIRAASGCRPVIRLAREDADGPFSLLRTNAPLVLEGLELHRVSSKSWRDSLPDRMVWCEQSPLHAANCRFFLDPGGGASTPSGRPAGSSTVSFWRAGPARSTGPAPGKAAWTWRTVFC